MGLLRRHVQFASGKDIQGIKFLRGLDQVVTNVMKDPTEFSHQYMHSCPAGAAAFAVAAAMLSLMSNPSLFERFANLGHYVLVRHTDAVVAGAAAWGVFHALAKLAAFAMRSFDLFWSRHELLPLPESTAAFDALRLDAPSRTARLERSSAEHAHGPTRQLAAFLLRVSRRLARRGGGHPEVVVYLTAVGGLPFANYVASFIQHAVAVGLPALVVACMDPDAHLKCTEAVGADYADTVHCVAIFEGHVVLVKHTLLPVLLSAAVDTVWVDFDTFILRDPTPHLLEARDSPERILPARSRIRFGSFLFDNASEMCAVSKICDSRMQWPWQISGEDEYPQDPAAGEAAAGASKAGGVEMLVTEHWNARCLNNGFFYVRATHRPLVFFTHFLARLYVNPYTDNQNLFDAFLAHSILDSAVPETRPLLRYALLDIERRHACAEGHAGTPAGLVTFHFWSSDFRTREVGDEEEPVVGAAPAPEASAGDTAGEVPDAGVLDGGAPRPEPAATRPMIRTRDGTARVEKAGATKAELFELFFGAGAQAQGINGEPSAAAADFIERVKVPPPTWKGMCSVTAVGIEELVDERMLQNEQALVDWETAAAIPGDDADADGVNGSEEEWGLHETPAAFPQPMAPDGPQCSGIRMQDWTDALRSVADLEDALLLERAEAVKLKAQLRRLDIGCLMTLQAFRDHGKERLALELRGAIDSSDSSCGST